ncbi:MAG: mechanosensitive ion channel family protein [Terriglobia bacterium]
MGELISRTINETSQNLGGMVTQFLPHLLAMIVIVVVGGIVAWILKIIARRILALVKFNHLVESTGFTQLAAGAGLPSASELLSRVIFWVVWVSFWLFGLNALGVAALQDEISRFFLLLPQIFVAIVILVIGALLANFLGRATLLGAVNANYPAPRLLSSAVRLLIIAIAIMMALERVGLAHGVVLIAFSAIMLALALAFGLGGRDAARRLLEKTLFEVKNEEGDDDRISHL